MKTTLKRFWMLLVHEIRLARTALPIQIVAIPEPAVMYALMTVILVHPTFDVHVTRPDGETGQKLVAAMLEIASPIGLPYINPLLVDTTSPANMRQVITIEEHESGAVAVQRYNLIDNNLVKNYRNRLTAAAMYLWNETLGERAVKVVEFTDMPRDIPYNIYFGMAMLPLTAFLASALTGAVLTAQEIEFKTIMEYRSAPISPVWVVVARLVRLALTGLLASVLVLVTIGLFNRAWPEGWPGIFLALLPMTLLGGCLGMLAGIRLRATLPAFLVSLVVSFLFWIVGDAFKPSATVGGWYHFFSNLTPHSNAVTLLYPHYYHGTYIRSSLTAALILTALTLAVLLLTVLVYRRRVTCQE